MCRYCSSSLKFPHFFTSETPKTLHQGSLRIKSFCDFHPSEANPESGSWTFFLVEVWSVHLIMLSLALGLRNPQHEIQNPACLGLPYITIRNTCVHYSWKFSIDYNAFKYINTQWSLWFEQSDWFAISEYDVIFTALGGEYKAKQNRCRELGVLPKFSSKNVLKIQEYLTVDDFEGRKRLHGV